MKKDLKVKIGLLAAILMFTGTASVSAATMNAQENRNTGLEAFGSEEAEEYTEAGFAENISIEVGELNGLARGVNTYGWSIGKNSAKCSNGFQAYSGGYITVTATAATNTSYRIGIIQPDGSLRYVPSSNGIAGHQFTLEQSGTYCIYIQNMKSEKLDVCGSYYY